MSVIKQENRKLFKKNLRTPFLSSALKYRITTHILPVFSYSEEYPYLPFNISLVFFSRIFTCDLYLLFKTEKGKKKEN